MFGEMDRDGDGTIEFVEFVGYMAANGFSTEETADPELLVDSIFKVQHALRTTPAHYRHCWGIGLIRQCTHHRGC